MDSRPPSSRDQGVVECAGLGVPETGVQILALQIPNSDILGLSFVI